MGTSNAPCAGGSLLCTKCSSWEWLCSCSSGDAQLSCTWDGKGEDINLSDEILAGTQKLMDDVRTFLYPCDLSLCCLPVTGVCTSCSVRTCVEKFHDLHVHNSGLVFVRPATFCSIFPVFSYLYPLLACHMRCLALAYSLTHPATF